MQCKLEMEFGMWVRREGESKLKWFWSGRMRAVRNRL